MAIYYLDTKPVQRSLGQSAVAAAAYAAGKDLYDERAQEMQRYGRKRGVFHEEIGPGHAPEWVYDQEALWNRAERAEKRVDAQPARLFVLALPCELTDEQKIELVTTYVREVLVSEGMVVDIGLHRAHERGDRRNDHAHLVVTMRELDGDNFAATKNREWNRKDTLEYWREEWANYQNDALEEAGFDARVDHCSFEERGIERESTIHMGKDATEMEREGIATDLGDKNREIAERNQALEERLQEQAALDVKIAQEQAHALEEPDAFSFPTAPSSEPEPPLLQEEREHQAVSAFTDAWTLAYMKEQPPALEVRQAEDERRWYDPFYSTIETIQETAQRYWAKLSDYWQRYVRGNDRGPDRQPEPEDDFGR